MRLSTGEFEIDEVVDACAVGDAAEGVDWRSDDGGIGEVAAPNSEAVGSTGDTELDGNMTGRSEIDGGAAGRSGFDEAATGVDAGVAGRFGFDGLEYGNGTRGLGNADDLQISLIDLGRMIAGDSDEIIACNFAHLMQSRISVMR